MEKTKKSVYSGIPVGLAINSLSLNEEKTYQYAQVKIMADKNELTVFFSRKTTVPSFVLNKISTADGNILWSYNEEKKFGFSGYCYLYEVNNNFFIGFVENMVMVRVLPVLDIGKRKVRLVDSDTIFYEGQNIGRMIRMRRFLSREYGYGFNLPVAEKNTLDLSEKAQEQNAKDNKARKKAHRDEVNSRLEIYAWNGDTRLRGIPVQVGSNDEYCLRDNTYVIVVDQYNSETKEYGKLLGAGYMKDRKLKILRSNDLTREKVFVKKEEQILVVSNGLFIMKKGREELELQIVSREDLRAGNYPNSGSRFAVQYNELEYEVYQAKGGSKETIGLAKLIAQV
jgi:hypothetical protein